MIQVLLLIMLKWMMEQTLIPVKMEKDLIL